MVGELVSQVGGRGSVAAAVAKDAAVAGANAIAVGAKNAWTVMRDLFDEQANVAPNQSES